MTLASQTRRTRSSRSINCAGTRVSSCDGFFEEKSILRHKRTGMPDHTRDSHSATKRERDVDIAKLKAGGRRAQAGSWAPRSKGVRVQKPSAVPAGRKGGRGMLLGKEVSAVSAALGAAVVDAGLDEHVARKADRKVRQTAKRRGAGHAHRSRGQGEQWSGSGRSDSKSSRQTGHDTGLGGGRRREKFGGNVV
jgi:hypothetical protein